MSSLSDLARIVDEAARTATAIPQLTETLPDLSVADSYAVQAMSIAHRRARGERHTASRWA